MTILDQIVEQKKREVSQLPPGLPSPEQLAEAMRARGPVRDFTAALRHPRRPLAGLIAEVKKASPSAGLIRPDFDPIRIARDYEGAGADCLSVLTDEKFFQGSLEFLKAIRSAVRLPLLRKDFIIDPRQVAEAIAWGADAILLIAAILTDTQLQEFHHLARRAGLAVLVEVHDEPELDRVLGIGADLVGVNNRNLKNFTVDLATTERLAATLKSRSRERDILLVAESGIHTHADVSRLVECGARAILVGESLMRHPDISTQVHTLMTGS